MKFLFLFSLFALISCAPLSPKPVGHQTMLPLEVISFVPVIRTVDVEVKAELLPTAKKLWLRVHHLNYEDKGAVSINGGAPISFNSQNVVMEDLAGEYGGFGGGFSTLDFTIALPEGALKPGINTLSFHFKQQKDRLDGGTVGFRVIGINLKDESGKKLIPDAQFTQDDPAKWTAPEGANAESGKNLWHTAELKNEQGNVMRARCTDCHSDDGRDLKYFGYSNLSIIERTKFHGLTEQQGKDIAAYIRTLPIEVPKKGRPWNPLYQPGPGLDSQPASEWSAGAGLEAVLAKDSDMEKYIFPDGIKASAINTDKNLSAREVPIAFQLLDWNHWLPRIHPLDSWGSLIEYKVPAPADKSALLDWYRLIKEKLDSKPGVQGLREGHELITALLIDSAYNLRPAAKWVDWEPDTLKSVQKYSLAQWMATKLWYVHEKYGLTTMGRDMYGPQAEPLTWFAAAGPFTFSPNLLHISREFNGLGKGSEDNFIYVSLAWYHLQLILNNGNRFPPHLNGGAPLDWAYIIGFPNGFKNPPPSIMLNYLYMVKAAQGYETGLGANRSQSGGWNGDAVNMYSFFASGFASMWADTTNEKRKALVEVMLRVWLDKSKQSPPNLWHEGDNIAFVSEGYTPGGNPGVSFPDRVMAMWVHTFNDHRPSNMKSFGIDVNLQNEYLDWAISIWPQFTVQWNALRPN